MSIHYIQPGEPNQNAYIERFSRTYRPEVLDLYIFRTLNVVREITHWWKIEYNEQQPHNSLGDLAPSEFLSNNAGTLFFYCFLGGEAYAPVYLGLTRDFLRNNSVCTLQTKRIITKSDLSQQFPHLGLSIDRNLI